MSTKADEEIKNKENVIFSKNFISYILGYYPLKLISLPKVSESLWRNVSFNTKDFCLSPHIIFMLIQEFIIHNNNEILDVLREYLCFFPEESIPFVTYINMVFESGILVPDTTCGILSTIHPKYLYYDETKLGKNKFIEVISIIYSHVLLFSEKSSEIFLIETYSDFIDYNHIDSDGCERISEFVFTSNLSIVTQEDLSRFSQIFPVNRSNLFIKEGILRRFIGYYTKLELNDMSAFMKKFTAIFNTVNSKFIQDGNLSMLSFLSLLDNYVNIIYLITIRTYNRTPGEILDFFRIIQNCRIESLQKKQEKYAQEQEKMAFFLLHAGLMYDILSKR